jgi:basic membrane protein A
MSDGCVIIGQHADSTGAPSAVQAALDAGTVAYSVGYNIDMLSVAPTAALTSSTNNWEVFYEYAFNCIINGETMSTDWAEGYETGAVGITALGESCAEGTAEKVAEVEAALTDGSLNVFDCSTFTVDGEHPTSILIDMDGDFTGETEGVVDGVFQESVLRSAPGFTARIDGITELNAG